MGRTDGRCVGCGQPATNIQHRKARGMGGTRSVSVGHPANGLPMCGSGTTGCHGWTEANPAHALALGWRLDQAADPTLSVFWSVAGPWRWNLVDTAGLLHYVDIEDLPPALLSRAATASLEFADYLRDR